MSHADEFKREVDMHRLIREPLLHFFLLGAVLFSLYGWLDRDGFDGPNEIVVSRGQVEPSCWQRVVAIFGASAFPTSSGHFLEAAQLVPLTLLVSDSSSEQAQTFAAH